MMFRTAFLLLLSSSVVSSTPLLRDGKFVADDTDGGRKKKHDKPKPDAGFCLEKGIKCGGVSFKGKGRGVKCEGGAKFGMEKKIPRDAVESLAQGMHDHMYEGYLPAVDEFMPSDEVMAEIMAMEQLLMEEAMDSDEGGKGRSVEFGGFAGIKWGCKVDFSKKDNKIAKVGGCEVKGMKGVGMKTPGEGDFDEIDISFPESSIFATDNDDSDGKKKKKDDKPKPDSAFGVEKGIKCGGAVFNGKGKGVKCEGGVKFGMSKKKTREGVEAVAQGMHDHMHSGYLPEVDEFMPSDEVMEMIMHMEEEMSTLEEEEGSSVGRGVEFGGFAGFKWGCKVSFSVKDGKFIKVGGCGAKGMKGVGRKTADETDFDEITME